MSLRKKRNAEKRAERYAQRKKNKDVSATLWEASRYLGESIRSLQQRGPNGSPKWEMRGHRRRYAWSDIDSYMAGGADEWLTTAETAVRTGKTLRQLELMRAKNVGPSCKVFGKKTVRYDRHSVDAYNQAASSMECKELIAVLDKNMENGNDL